MRRILQVVLMLAFTLSVNSTFGQGATTSSINGVVEDANGGALPGATVLAIHEPSGTRYGTSTLVDGRFFIPGMRVGGPYSVTTSFVGYENQKKENIYLTLSVAANVNFTMAESGVELGEVVIAAQRNAVFSSDRTGASTSVGRDAIENFPTISRRIGDFTRLTPQANGSSFAGQDNRLNNITVDGSYFNNSFGLGGQPGDRTGVSPISLDAIEQIQVNIAPYDVRQGNFVGAGVNTVTRSGTNEFSGSAYYLFRNENMVGSKAEELEFTQGDFSYNQIGARLGGPIIKNKLFFFTSFEKEDLTQPATTFRANTGGETVDGNITRVLASDLEELSNFLRTNFDYETGPYQGYKNGTGALKFLAKLDYNLNDNNKISLRYNHLDSDTDVLMSNSSSLGFGSRNLSLFGLNYQNSNYKIIEDIRSVIGEWNSRLTLNMSNNLIVGYTYQDESRESLGSFFPMVDILEEGRVYTSFGFEPFTPNNELRYSTFQLQDNLTVYKANHTMTYGISMERYESENIFFPGSQSAYVYNSLDDFYTDANNYLNGTNTGDTSQINLRRFQVRYAAQPGLTVPVQPLKVFYTGVYAQDEWKVSNALNLTLGLRIDVPFFGDTGFRNTEVEGFTFRDENGDDASYATDKLPDPNLLWSPRVGFNWDVTGDRSTQLRGGSGIFTGRPAYVWISNQVGNNGVLTGFIQADNTVGYPFNPDPATYKPVVTTVQPAPSYELALADPNFKFPQVWRTNLAVDQQLPWGMVGTAEVLYTRDVNGIYYINANLPEASTAYAGPDDRPRWAAGNRINSKITNAVVLKNQNQGMSYNLSASLEKPFTNGFYGKAGYNYGVSKNTIDAGSIAAGSWFNNAHSGDPNDPGVSFSSNSSRHRVFAAASYKKEYFNFGGTTVSLFWETRTIGNSSFIVSGDMNGDGGTANDLIYVPAKGETTNFQEYVSGEITFTAEQQAAAWEAFIEQDKYLSSHRGEYVERGAVFLPMVSRADFSIVQELFTNIGTKRNTLQFRADILNVGNLLNKNWGVSQQLITDRPLVSAAANAEGEPVYRLASVNGQLVSSSYRQTLTVNDVYRIQIGLRYIFN